MTDRNSKNSASPNTSTCLKGMSEEPKVTSRLQIIKNLIVICVGFTLFFTAYNGLSMLQSTMNQNQGIGVASQAIIYAGFGISASMFPKYTIRKLGCKRALLLSMSCYIPYIAANFYFNWLIMVPSAILVGLGSSVLWSSNCTYMTTAAERYSNITIREIYDKEKDLKLKLSNINRCVDMKFREDNSATGIAERTLRIDVLNCRTLECLDLDHNLKYNDEALCSNNGANDAKLANSVKDTFNCVSKSSLNSCVDKQEPETDFKDYQSDENSQNERSKIVSSVTARIFGFAGLAHRSTDIWSNLMSYYVLQDNNVLVNLTENDNCSCGASFCNIDTNCFEHNLAEPSPQMRNILTGISVLLAGAAVIMIFLFLDELETDKKPIKFSFNLLMATCKFVVKKEALLLLPLSSYIGFQQGFYIGDFTKSYIACAWGVYHVGLVTMSYGLAAGISSMLAGILVKYVGRMAVILGGGVINAGINIYLLIWNPLPNQPTRFFISAACWGIAIGILWSQLRAFYGVIFKDDKEVAFAGFYLWDAIGYCVSFSYSNYICTYFKIYILLAVSTIGIIGYVRTESLYKQSKKMCKSTG